MHNTVSLSRCLNRRRSSLYHRNILRSSSIPLFLLWRSLRLWGGSSLLFRRSSSLLCNFCHRFFLGSCRLLFRRCCLFLLCCGRCLFLLCCGCCLFLRWCRLFLRRSCLLFRWSRLLLLGCRLLLGLWCGLDLLGSVLLVIQFIV